MYAPHTVCTRCILLLRCPVTSRKIADTQVGIRFLTDYLQGDVYFRTSRPGENLDRRRTQLALVQRMLDQEPSLNAIVARCAASLLNSCPNWFV